MQKVPQWFWRDDCVLGRNHSGRLTANLQGWTLSHGMFEFSDKMEMVETYKLAFYDATARVSSIGLDDEAVLYDPDAFAQPLHVTSRFARRATTDDPNQRIHLRRVARAIRETRMAGWVVTTSADPRFIDQLWQSVAQNWDKFLRSGLGQARG